MDTKYSEYIAFLKKYRDELSVSLENEREKRLALLSNDSGRIEAMLQVQQAAAMKLRGFEKKRMELQSGLDLPDARAKELIAAINDSEARTCIDGLFTEIAELATNIREQNGQSIELAKNNQKIIDYIMGTGESQAKSIVYGPENGHRKVFSTGNTFEETV